jgi:competence protein ComEC
MRLIYLSLAWIIGICSGMWAGSHWVALAAIAGVVLSGFLLRHGQVVLFVLCLAALLSGFFRFQSTVTYVDESALQFYNDRGIIQIKGLVAADPEPAGSLVALRLEAREIFTGEEWKEVTGTALIYAPQLQSPDFLPTDISREPPYYRYGDMLQVEGELETPPEFEDFDWRDYLARRGIHSLISYPDHVELLAIGQGFEPREWIYQLRDRMSRSLESNLHEPQASLAQAVLLGKRSTVPDELRESLSQAGTAHILAISGLHIFIFCGIVFSFVVAVFGRKRPFYFWLPLIATWGYILLSGAQVSAIRAAIMVSLWLLAYYIGRPRSALPWLLFAAAVMIGFSPSILSDVSFQMSFAAMAGIILLTPHIQSWSRRTFRVTEGRRKPLGFFVDSLSFTLGAVLAIMPIIAYYFHQISLVALPANLFALPALPGAIGTAAIVAIVGLFAPALAHVLGWIAWLFISYIIEVTGFFSSLPFASVELKEVSAFFVWGYYAILGVLLWIGSNWSGMGSNMRRAKAGISSVFERFGQVPARFIIFPLIIVAALVWTAAFTAPDNRLHVFCFDVGQGDAILIQKGQKQVLVDGGPDAESICLELGDKLPFWDRTIELVILTHPEADHLTGLVEVLQRYEVNQVLANGQECDSLVCGEWLREVEERDMERAVAGAGQRIELAEDVYLEVLNPGAGLLQGTASDANNNSVVVRLVCGDFSLLLTGDIFEEAEQCLLDRRSTLSSVVLKVPHHGSATSSCLEFLNEVEPQVAVISVGAENEFGHPDPGVVERLVQVVGEDNLYLTSEHGTIELITDGTRLWVKTER